MFQKIPGGSLSPPIVSLSTCYIKYQIILLQNTRFITYITQYYYHNIQMVHLTCICMRGALQLSVSRTGSINDRAIAQVAIDFTGWIWLPDTCKIHPNWSSSSCPPSAHNRLKNSLAVKKLYFLLKVPFNSCPTPVTTYYRNKWLRIKQKFKK